MDIKIVLTKILRNPLVILLGAILGCFIGGYWKNVAAILEPIGTSYISLLLMAILPMVVAMIILNVAKLLHSHLKARYLLSFFLLLLIIMVVTSVLSSILAMFFSPHLHLKREIEMALGGLLTVSYYPPTSVSVAATNFAMFLREIIPSNVFLSLSEGISLKLIVISLLIGLGLGVLPEKRTAVIYGLLEQTRALFHLILDWLLLFMPIGLLFLLAGVMIRLDLEMLLSLLKLGLLIYCISLVLLLLYIAVTAFVTKTSFLKTCSYLKGPLSFTFVVASGILSLPQSLEAQNKLKVSPMISSTMFPLGIVLNRQGKIVLLAILATILMRFYYHTVFFNGFLMINFLAIVLGSTASGRGATLAPFVLLMANILGLPEDPAVTILIVVSPFVFQILSVVTVAANILVVALFDNFFAKKHKEGDVNAT